MNHLELGIAESDALEATPFENFHERCMKLCSRHLHLDHRNQPSFDGDQATDGYSLDWLHDHFEAGKRPLDVLHVLLWRKHGLHR